MCFGDHTAFSSFIEARTRSHRIWKELCGKSTISLRFVPVAHHSSLAFSNTPKPGELAKKKPAVELGRDRVLSTSIAFWILFLFSLFSETFASTSPMQIRKKPCRVGSTQERLQFGVLLGIPSSLAHWIFMSSSVPMGRVGSLVGPFLCLRKPALNLFKKEQIKTHIQSGGRASVACQSSCGHFIVKTVACVILSPCRLTATSFAALLYET